MKAIIPVAGAGTKLRPLTYTQPKPLIPVAGKPIISFIIDQLSAVGVTEYIFIIGYLGEKIQNYVDATYPHLHKEYVLQESREGSGHAIWVARSLFKSEDEVIIFFGDTIIDIDFEQMVKASDSYLGISPVEQPWEYGVAEIDEAGLATKLIEKPRIPKSNMALVGFYKIKEVSLLIEALEHNVGQGIQTNEEYPLTDALMYMVSKGAQLKTLQVDNWFNCGKYEVLLKTNALLLDREGYASHNLPNFDNSIIINPVSIGKDCKIVNSIIGPHVTIRGNAQIESSIIRDSIIGNYAAIHEAVLMNSIIGNDTSIKGFRQSLNIGDNTEIDFS
ncbi:MAG: sugar phosphate nucleotidyltransferase [Bacteroidota bacterium]